MPDSVLFNQAHNFAAVGAEQELLASGARDKANVKASNGFLNYCVIAKKRDGGAVLIGIDLDYTVISGCRK
jgi:hypothetical protein